MARSGASAGTRTRVQALATPGDNHYTTLAGKPPILQGFKRLSAKNHGPRRPPTGPPSLHAKSVATALATSTGEQGQNRDGAGQDHQTKNAEHRRTQTVCSLR